MIVDKQPFGTIVHELSGWSRESMHRRNNDCIAHVPVLPHNVSNSRYQVSV